MSFLSLFGGRNKRAKKLPQDRRHRQKRRMLLEQLQMRELMAADLHVLVDESFDDPAALTSSMWETSSTNVGRLKVNNGRLEMDASQWGNSLNEAVLHLNLEGKSGVKLTFDHDSVGDENSPMSQSFIGSENSDGVAISADGQTWHRLTSLTSDFTNREFDLDAAIRDAGIEYTVDFQIKFQQFDNWTMDWDGRAFDNINVTYKSDGKVNPQPEKAPPTSVLVDEVFSTAAALSTPAWEIPGDNAGRVRVRGGRLEMDTEPNRASTKVLNEAILHVDLAGRENVLLTFDHDSVADEDDQMPASFVGRHQSDGVAISADGTTWHRLTSLTRDFSDRKFDLDAVIKEAGIEYTSDFQIKFQQYDNFDMTLDGRAFDNITLTAAAASVVNRAPQLEPLVDVNVPEGQHTSVVIVANDPDGDALQTPLLTGLPTFASFDAQASTISFSPNFDTVSRSDAVRDYPIHVAVSDGAETTSQTFTLTVHHVNQAPALEPLGDVTLNEGQSELVTIVVSDLDNDLLEAPIVTGLPGFATFDAETGTIQINPSFETLSNAAPSRNYPVTVTVSDGTDMASENFILNVNNVNRAPTGLILSSSSIEENRDTGSVVGTFATADEDKPNESFSYQLVSGPGDNDNRFFVIDGAQLQTNEVFDFEARDAYNVHVRTTDQGGLSFEQPLTIAVTDTNDRPQAHFDIFVVQEDSGPRSVDVLANDIDVDSSELTVISVGQAENGTATLLDNGRIRYKPRENFSGLDTFSYTVADADGATDEATVYVSVVAVNDAAVLESINSVPPSASRSVAIVEGAPQSIELLVSDVDNSRVTLELNNAPDFITVGESQAVEVALDDSGKGSATIVATPGYADSGSYPIQVSLTDDRGEKVIESLTVHVREMNRSPAIRPSKLTVPEDGLLRIDLRDYVIDEDGDAVQLVGATAASNGVVEKLGYHTLQYRPDPDYVGGDLITYAITDGKSEEVHGSFTVNVTTVNDRPQIASIPDQNIALEPAVFLLEGFSRERTIHVPIYVTDRDGDDLSITAEAIANSFVMQLQREFQLQSEDKSRFNSLGLGEKWLISKSGRSYLIMPTGTILVWSGSGEEAPAPAQVVAQVDAAAYQDPALFLNATPTAYDGVTARVVNGQVELGIAAATAGTFDVLVTVNDGTSNGTEVFTVNVRPAESSGLGAIFARLTSGYESALPGSDGAIYALKSGRVSNYAHGKWTVLNLSGVTGLFLNDRGEVIAERTAPGTFTTHLYRVQSPSLSQSVYPHPVARELAGKDNVAITDDRLYVLRPGGPIEQYDGLTKTWKNVSAGKTFSTLVGSGNEVFALSRDRILYRRVGTSWVNVASGQATLVSNAAGDVYSLSEGENLYRWSANTPTAVGTGHNTLVRNGNGDVYTLGNDHVLYRWEATSWNAIGTGHLKLVTNIQGDAYTLGNDNVLFRWVGTRWTKVGTGHVTLASSASGDVYTLGGDRVLYHWVGKTWKSVGTGHIELISNANGEVYTLGNDDIVYRWVGSKWKAIGTSHLRLVSNGAGDAYTLGRDRKLYLWTGETPRAIGSGHLAVTVDGANHVYTLGVDGIVYHWSGSTWKSLGGDHSKPVVGHRGDAYVLGSDQVLYRWEGTTYRAIGTGHLTLVANSRGDVYTLGNDHVLYRWEGTSWKAIGSGHNTLVRNANGDVYTLGNDHILYRWMGTSWKAIGSGHGKLVTSANGDAYTLGNDHVLYRWVGTNWKAIGSGHNALVRNANGDVYTLGNDDILYRWAETSWRAIGSGHGKLVANANGDAYTLGNDHVLYRWEGTSWKAIGSGHIDLSVSAGGDAHTLGNDNAVYRWVGNRWKIVQRFGLTLAQQYAQGRDTLVSDISHDLRRQIAGLPGNVKNVSVTSLQLVGDKIKGEAKLTLGQDWGEYFGKRVRATRDFPVSFTHNTVTGHTEMTGIYQSVDLSVTVSGRKFGTQFKLAVDLDLFNQVFDLYDRAVRPTLKHLSGGNNFAAKVDTPIPSLKLSAPKVPSRVLPAVKVPPAAAAIPSVELPHIVKDPVGWVKGNVIAPGLDGAKEFSNDLDQESRRLGGDIAREGKKLGGDIAREGKNGIAYVQELIADAFGQVPDGFDQPLKAFEKIMGSFSRLELEVPGISAAFDKLSSAQMQVDPDVALALPDMEKLQQFNSSYLKDELLATLKEKLKQFTGIFNPDYTQSLVDKAGKDLGIVLGYDSASKMVKAGFNAKFVWMKFEFTVGYEYFWEPANPDRWRAVATTSAGIKDSDVRVEYEYSTGRGEEFPDVIRQSAGYKDDDGASAVFDQWAHVEFNPKSQDVHFGPINIELKADSGQFGVGVSAIQEHKSGQLTALRPNNIWLEARTRASMWTAGGRLTLQYVPEKVTEITAAEAQTAEKVLMNGDKFYTVTEQDWEDADSWEVIVTPQLGFNNVLGFKSHSVAVSYNASQKQFVNATISSSNEDDPAKRSDGFGVGQMQIIIDANGNVARVVIDAAYQATLPDTSQAPPNDSAGDPAGKESRSRCSNDAAHPDCNDDTPSSDDEPLPPPDDEKATFTEEDLLSGNGLFEDPEEWERILEAEIGRLEHFSESPDEQGWLKWGRSWVDFFVGIGRDVAVEEGVKKGVGSAAGGVFGILWSLLQNDRRGHGFTEGHTLYEAVQHEKLRRVNAALVNMQVERAMMQRAGQTDELHYPSDELIKETQLEILRIESDIENSTTRFDELVAAEMGLTLEEMEALSPSANEEKRQAVVTVHQRLGEDLASEKQENQSVIEKYLPKF